MKTRIHIAAPLIALSLAATGVAFGQQGDKLGKVEFPNSCTLRRRASRPQLKRDSSSARRVSGLDQDGTWNRLCFWLHS